MLECHISCAVLTAEVGVYMCVAYMQGLHVCVEESTHLARVLVGECYKRQKVVSVGGHSPESCCVSGGCL